MINSENMTCAIVPPPSNFPLQGEGLRAKGNWPLPASPSLAERDLGRGQGTSDPDSYRESGGVMILKSKHSLITPPPAKRGTPTPF